jgi:hypothetical protein
MVAEVSGKSKGMEAGDFRFPRHTGNCADRSELPHNRSSPLSLTSTHVVEPPPPPAHPHPGRSTVSLVWYISTLVVMDPEWFIPDSDLPLKLGSEKLQYRGAA